MSDPRAVLAGFARLDRVRRSRRRLNYHCRVVASLAGAFGYSRTLVVREYEAMRDRDQAAVFLEAMRGHKDIAFPRNLFIEDGPRITAMGLWTKPRGNYYVSRLLEILGREGHSIGGLIFPVTGRGDWVAHNLPVKMEAGVGRMVVPAGAGLPDLQIVELKQFTKERHEGQKED